jgi:hypothetical protein
MTTTLVMAMTAEGWHQTVVKVPSRSDDRQNRHRSAATPLSQPGDSRPPMRLLTCAIDLG